MPSAKLLTKFAPEGGSGKVRNLTSGLRLAGSGVGFQTIGRTVDGLLLRGFFSSIGFNVPVLNIRMDLIDVGNYLAHNGGSIMPKSSRPFIALGAAKITEGSLSISRFSPNTNTNSSTAGTTSTGASA